MFPLVNSDTPGQIGSYTPLTEFTLDENHIKRKTFILSLENNDMDDLFMRAQCVV